MDVWDFTPFGPVTRDDLRARVADLLRLANGEEAMRNRWPHGVPTLANVGHSQNELDAILTAVRLAESDVEAGWHPMDAPRIQERRAAAQPVKAPPVFEGPLVDAATFNALKARVDALSPEQALKLAAVTGESHRAGRSVSLTIRRSRRRWSIGRALVVFAESELSYDDVMLFAAEIATEAQVGCSDLDGTLGGLISLFTTEQADLLFDMISGAVSVPVGAGELPRNETRHNG